MRKFNPNKELYKIQHRNKKRIILFVISLLIVGVIGYSFALYQVRYSRRIIYTKVAPFSNYDVNLAVYVDGKKEKEFPEKGSNYTYTFIECETKTEDYTIGSWDEEKWSLTVETKGPNKCNVYFSSAENVKTYELTSEVEEYTIPKTGTYLLEVWGAQGGDNGGYGGHSYGQIKLNQGDILYVVVGGSGKLGTSTAGGAGGYNGGGAGGSGCGINGGAGGGGATHIAIETGLLSTLSSSKESVLIVAGGGGGKSVDHSTIYGSGGGLSGGDNDSFGRNKGGTQTTGYAFGLGGAAANSNCSFGGGWNNGGGGGGYYGGYGLQVYNNSPNTNGGGGSGYLNASKLIAGTTRTENGIRVGDGMARIVFLR